MLWEAFPPRDSYALVSVMRNERQPFHITFLVSGLAQSFLETSIFLYTFFFLLLK